MPRTLSCRLPWSLAAMIAVGAAGCSSYDTGAFDPSGGYDDDWDGEGGTSTTGDADEPAAGEDTGQDDGGADPGGGELPPEPDDDGVDNGSEPTEQCDADHDVARILLPDDSSSMSSPVQVREAVLGESGDVQGVGIRTWEFFNYYDFGYPAAHTDPVAVSPALLELADEPGEYLLQVGVSSRALADDARAPVDLTLVLDTSSSMAGEPMELLVDSSRAIAASLRAGDTISIVTWSSDHAVVLAGHQVSGPDDAALAETIDALQPGGGTDLHAGLVAGYELARAAFDASRTNRVVLISDGTANAGIADVELIAEQAGGPNEHGIYMVGVGVGDPLSYHDDLMDVVTDVGKGASVFVPTIDEAWKVLHDDFTSTMAVAARDVRLRLDLPPGFEVVSTRLDGDFDVGQQQPQDLAPNDAMVFHQRIRTCAPQMLTEDTMVTVTVLYRDAQTFEERERPLALPLSQMLQAEPAPLLKGAAVFAYAESLKAYKNAELDAKLQTMDGAFAALERAEAAAPGDPELAEIRAVLEALAQR